MSRLLSEREREKLAEEIAGLQSLDVAQPHGAPADSVALVRASIGVPNPYSSVAATRCASTELIDFSLSMPFGNAAWPHTRPRAPSSRPVEPSHA
jgi:hypothetical protein